jgi:RTA1 like protein
MPSTSHHLLSVFFVCRRLLLLFIARIRSPLVWRGADARVVETVGYAGRAWSHYDPLALGPYIIQSILILIAPALFAASLYMVLGRIITLVHGQRHAIIPLRFLTKIFVAGDCLAFLIQMTGAGIQAGGTLQLLHLGGDLIVVGLFFQIFMFGFFIITATMFDVRYTRYGAKEITSIPWRSHLVVLYSCSGIILVRSIFRVIEYLMGNDGWIVRHEIMLYVFDALLMLSVVLLIYIKHPGSLVFNRETSTESLQLVSVANRPGGAV